MLLKLVIRNYAIIDRLTLDPDTGLNTVTGETGAGKSIILGALSLILGDRADTGVLINKEEKCVVEAHFEVADNEAFRAALRREELDDDAQCIIRREIAVSGKSRAFINDTPVTLTTLNHLTSLLVDLHQQFGHLALQDDTFQVDVLDAVGTAFPQREKYRAAYRRFRQVSAELADLVSKQAQWQKESDYNTYLFEELQTASFREGEVEDSETRLKSLSHAERIQGVLAGGRIALDEGEQPLATEVRKLAQSLSSIQDVMPESVPLCERLNGAYAELKDIASELEILEGKVSLDPEEMQTLQDRMDLGYKLFKKHGVTSTAELLAVQTQLEESLQGALQGAENIERLTAERTAAQKAMQAEAQKLTDARKKVSPQISKRVTELLALVGMPNARFDIQVNPAKDAGPLGADDVQFLLDANRSGRFQPIHKAASGGEMSRIMLCIKSLTAKALHLPTLIFDEVDTGISGEAARQVGYLLRDLSQHHQVVVITHQPQVAARGARHFFVYKDAEGKGRITTKVRLLEQGERVLAIARMIGGEQPSEAALANARELVEA